MLFFNKFINKKYENKVPKTVQATIPYIAVSKEGIIQIARNKFSKTIKFEDINYQIARVDDQENIFIQYCKLLNYFDSNFELEITINNKYIDKKGFKEVIELELKGDSLDEYRIEYNNMLQKQVREGKNNIRKDMYLTITTESKDFDHARKKFIKVENELQNNLKKMGSKSSVLELKDRLEILHDFFRVGEEGNFLLDDKFLRKTGIATKNIIAPDSFEFNKNYFMIGDKYARAIFLKDLPSSLSDKFVSDLIDMDKNLMTSFYIKPVDQEKAVKMIHRQITGMEGNKIEYQKRSIKNGYLDAFIPYELTESLNEAKELLDDVLNKNQKIFLFSMVMVHMANNKEELDNDTEFLKSIARKYICQLGVLNYQQEQGLKTVLPLGFNNLNIQRTLTTESTAIFIPFSTQELLQEDGMYYGKNATSRNLLLFNRLNLKNPNGFILGTPGSGKSFSAKREMLNIALNTDDDIIVIDPEREYTTLAQNLGGEVIHISAGSKNYINPLDLTSEYSDVDNPLLLKSEFILSLCECLIGGKTGLTSKEKTIIDRCVNKTYSEYFDSGFNKDKIPTLLDFQKILEEQNEIEAKDLSVSLELYTRGSLSIFANRTNVDTNNRFIIYDTKDLGKQLKTMGMLIVLDSIWNRVTRNRAKGKKTWIYMDEIYLLFANEYSATFLFELYKRARKWGAIPTGITQNVEDLLQSELARKMLSNSDFLLMLNQATSDRQELANLLDISETQISYITNSEEGEGLLFSGNSIIPFVDKFPKNTKLYKMMTTKVDEINAINVN